VGGFELIRAPSDIAAFGKFNTGDTRDGPNNVAELGHQIVALTSFY